MSKKRRLDDSIHAHRPSHPFLPRPYPHTPTTPNPHPKDIIYTTYSIPGGTGRQVQRRASKVSQKERVTEGGKERLSLITRNITVMDILPSYLSACSASLALYTLSSRSVMVVVRWVGRWSWMRKGFTQRHTRPSRNMARHRRVFLRASPAAYSSPSPVSARLI